MTTPRLSVLMPVYNTADFLPATFASLEAQALEDYEVIAIDNASNDGTHQLLEELARADSRIRVIGRERNVGPLQNARACLEHASGEFGMYLCGDDLLQPGAVRTLIDGLLERPFAGFAYGRFLSFQGDPPPRVTCRGSRTRHIASGEAFKLLTTTVNRVPFTGSVFRIALAREAGGFPTALRYSSDYHFWLRLAARANVVFISENVMYYRVHERSDTAAIMRTQKRVAPLEITLAKLAALDELPLVRKRMLAASCGWTIRKNALRALKHAALARRESPELAAEACRLAARSGDLCCWIAGSITSLALRVLRRANV